MTLRSNLFLFTGLALVVTAAACADNITQGTGDAQPAASTGAPPSNVSRSGEKAPTLDIQALTGIASVFTGPATPSVGASVFTIDVTGAGFPAGTPSQSLLVGVDVFGSKFQISRGLGVIPADGSVREIYSASCPSRFVEVYAVAMTGAWTIESKHVAPTC